MPPVYPVESFELESAAIGQRFHIDVSVPDGYDGSSDWPVAYFVDGNLAFNLAATVNSLCGRDLLDPGMKAAIVVGIGYPNAKDLSLLRVRELTPAGTVDDWFARIYEQMSGNPVATGGADAFLAFIQDQLHPEICRRYRVAGETAALFGDSYGGLFTFYALLREAPLFDRYWIGSPGVFGAGLALFDQLPDRLARGFDQPMRLSLTLGEKERHRSVGKVMAEEIYQEIARSYDRIVVALEGCRDPNLFFDAREFPGETHTSVFPASLTHAWRYLMRPAP